MEKARRVRAILPKNGKETGREASHLGAIRETEVSANNCRSRRHTFGLENKPLSL